MIQLVRTLAALIVAVGVALGLAAISPQRIVTVESVELPRTTRITCAVAGAALVDAAGDVDVKPVEGAASPVTAPARVETDGPVRISADARVSAGVLVEGDERAYAPCGGALTSGMVLVQDPADTELVLVNSDAGEAAVDLTIYGPDGEVTAVGARGILIAPGVVRRIALSVLAPDGPVAVSFEASQGRVAMLATSVEGRPTSLAAPTTPATQHLLAGAPTKATSAQLLLSNPGEDRLDVALEALGPGGLYVPAVSDSLSIPPKTTVRVSVTDALAGEATTLRASADQPFGAALVTTAGGQAATVVQTDAATSLSGLVPGAGELLVSNPDAAQSATLSVTLTPLGGEAVTSDVSVAAGASVAVPLPKGDPVLAEVVGDVAVVAAATSGTKAGTVVAPLTPAEQGEQTGLPTEIRPELG